jgi:hypothetical protein
VAAGWLVATLAGASVGAASGGLVGSLTGAGVNRDAGARIQAIPMRRAMNEGGIAAPPFVTSTSRTGCPAALGAYRAIDC